MILLPLLLLVPLLGAVACALAPNPRLAKQFALFFSLGTLLVAGAGGWWFYGAGNTVDLAYDGAEHGLELRPIGFAFRLGADGVSLWLIVLTCFLQPLAVAASFESIRE